MKKYIVNGAITASCYTVVEANSPEEALKIARERPVANMCYNPFDQDVEESWHIETDGEPYNINLD
jgi:hypothetical protein